MEKGSGQGFIAECTHCAGFGDLVSVVLGNKGVTQRKPVVICACSERTTNSPALSWTLPAETSDQNLIKKRQTVFLDLMECYDF